MQQLWDKLRRKVNDVQGKLPAGAGASIVNDDFGDVLGVFYGLTGDNYSFRELEDEAKLIKNELLKVKDVAKVEIYGVQTPTIDVTISPAVMAQSGVTTADIAHAFEAQNKVVDAGGVGEGVFPHNGLGTLHLHAAHAGHNAGGADDFPRVDIVRDVSELPLSLIHI